MTRRIAAAALAFLLYLPAPAAAQFGGGFLPAYAKISGGTGTENAIPKWDATGNTLADSSLTDDGSTVTSTVPVLLPAGSKGAPFLARSAASALGWWYGVNAASWIFGDATTDYLQLRGNASLLMLNSNGQYAWGSSTTDLNQNDGVLLDTILARAAAANLRFGAAAANPPIAQTLSVQNASGTDIAGANFTIDASQGTGTGAGGSVIIRTAAAGGTGSSLNALAVALTIDSTKLATFGGNIALAGNSITGTDNTPDLFAATARGQSAYLGTSLLVNTTAATALHADVTGGAGALNTVTSTGRDIITVKNAADAAAAGWIAYKTRSATGSDADTAVASGDDAMIFRALVADGAAYRETSRILHEVQTYTGSDNVSGQMIFYTRPTGAAGALTAALTLDQSQGATFGGTIVTGVTGDITSGRHITAGAAGQIFWTGRSTLQSGADGNIMVANQAATDFGRLQFGGTTTAFPALVRNGAALQVALGDGTLGGSLMGIPVAAQTIAAGGTVTADACGTIKRITSAGAVTTDTTNTFTAPAAANAGCTMYVVNVGSFNITLDNNALFVSPGGADVVLTANDAILVGSTGASGAWYALSALVAN